jgi:hypothetical protein
MKLKKQQSWVNLDIWQVQPLEKKWDTCGTSLFGNTGKSE